MVASDGRVAQAGDVIRGAGLRDGRIEPHTSMVSRQQARWIATKALRTHPSLARGISVYQVLGGEELGERFVRPYTSGVDRLEDCWVAYIETSMPTLDLSTIVVIAKSDGEVLFAGGVYDGG